jgi:hypothetical protein
MNICELSFIELWLLIIAGTVVGSWIVEGVKKQRYRSTWKPQRKRRSW